MQRVERILNADSLATVAAIDSMELARDSVGRLLAALDTAYTRDTVELTRWRTRWDSVTVRWTDTLRRVDTLTIDRVIAVAEGTINACTQALGTCEARVMALAGDTLLLRRQRDSVQALFDRAAKPKRWGCTVGVSYTVGDLVDQRGLTELANRAGVTCGRSFRLF